MGISISHIVMDFWVIYKEKRSFCNRNKTSLQILPQSICRIFCHHNCIYICRKLTNRWILWYIIPILSIKRIKIDFSQTNPRPNKLKARDILKIDILMITDVRLYFLYRLFPMNFCYFFDFSHWVWAIIVWDQ